jgi:hypothetical protein
MVDGQRNRTVCRMVLRMQKQQMKRTKDISLEQREQEMHNLLKEEILNHIKIIKYTKSHDKRIQGNRD